MTNAETNTTETAATVAPDQSHLEEGCQPHEGAPRAESKGAKILELIGRPKGAILAEIMKATDWQAHSVRGFLSTAGKKRGLNIESTKNEAGDRVYRIEAGPNHSSPTEAAAREGRRHFAVVVSRPGRS